MDYTFRREQVAKKAKFLQPELALGTLCVELPPAEDLELLGDVKRVLLQRR